VGDFWVGMKGDSYLHGKVNVKNSTLTGESLLYVYPDFETAIVGHFVNRILINGTETEILKVGCNHHGQMVVTKLAHPQGPQFWYESPNNTSQGSGPEGVPDPYERKWLKMVRIVNLNHFF